MHYTASTEGRRVTYISTSEDGNVNNVETLTAYPDTNGETIVTYKLTLGLKGWRWFATPLVKSMLKKDAETSKTALKKALDKIVKVSRSKRQLKPCHFVL